ncbi:Outer membrane protein assembly factor BamB [Planctomycetes bacterium Poly30]|uniref:Outer membrane protein assembly factor BamB n=1 Tax=Saltatorellus ferox TaxID=2528018 RepID=A0A518ELV1_9BACT|nr:Outer membrane protein assembly factor BamB [Planctomycetes bacterium Poly30]
MKAFVMRCPDCGAQLKADKGLTECTYCGTSIMIDDGKEAPADLAPPGAIPQVADASGPDISPRLILTGSLVLLVVSIIGIANSLREEGAASRVERGRAPTSRPVALSGSSAPKAPTIRWGARKPVVQAIDEDEVLDLVTSFDGADSEVYVAALNGIDGSVLWRTEAVPGLSGGARARILVGKTAVFAAGPTGELTAFSLREGGTLWTIRLAEVVASIHPLEGVEEPTVAVRLKDESHVRVSLARGGLQPGHPDEGEWPEALPSLSGVNENAGTKTVNVFGTRRMGELTIDHALVALDGSFQIGLGRRRKGSETPTLLRLDGVTGDPLDRTEWKEIWKTPIAGVDPLAARLPLGLSGFFHASHEYACAAYMGEGAIGMSPTRFSAFDMTDGRRLWDRELPERAMFTSVTVVGHRVYVVAGRQLMVLDVVSGELLFSVKELALA